MSRSYTCVVSFLSFVVMFMFVPLKGAIVFDVYRMLQYDRANVPFGSQRTSVNLLATTLYAKTDSLARYIIVAPMVQFNESLFDQVIEDDVDGMLLILPGEGNLDPESWETWHNLEKSLLNKNIQIPIYFSKAPIASGFYEELLLEDMHEGSPMYDNYRLVVNAPDPKPITNGEIANLQGWLAGAVPKSIEGDKAVPTIAIVAHYDSFAVAPDLAIGGDSNGSGVLALLELARLFSKLYGAPRNHGRFNLLFLLTGAGKLNYIGTHHWLETAESRVLKSIDFALCLDTIGSQNELFFHVSRPAKSEKTKALYDAFTLTAKEMSIPFDIIHRRINVSEPIANWQHERFSRKRIISATISHHKHSSPLFTECDIFDDGSRVDLNILRRNVKFIAESLAKYIYNVTNNENLSIFEGWLDIDSLFLSSWLNTITKRPRMVPYLTKQDPILLGLERVLADYVTDVSNNTYKLDSEFKFYDATKSTMAAYRVKPIIFDVVVSIIIATYIGALYVGLKLFTGDKIFPTLSTNKR